MNKLKQLLIGFSILMFLAMPLMAAGQSEAKAAAQPKSVEVWAISNPNETIIKAFDEAGAKFQEKTGIEVKYIRIPTNDFNTKVKSAVKFLNDGNRVKVTVRFRGREMAHTSLGQELLAKFGAECSEIATIAKDAKLEGRNMSMFLSPKNSK